MRTSNSRCFSVCGAGMNSSLETDWVGIGEGKADVSAGNNCFNSSAVRNPIRTSVYRYKIKMSVDPPNNRPGASERSRRAVEYQYITCSLRHLNDIPY